MTPGPRKRVKKPTLEKFPCPCGCEKPMYAIIDGERAIVVHTGFPWCRTAKIVFMESPPDLFYGTGISTARLRNLKTV